MKKDFDRRIKRLEARPPDCFKETKRSFWATVEASEADFGCEAETMTQAERIELLTPVQHLAWLRRFTGKADLEQVCLLHGRAGAPTDWLSFALLRAWIHGDDDL